MAAAEYEFARPHPCTVFDTPAHHQTGTEWPIYPTYDFAHGQEDAIEGVTHSICTLEFEDHRPLYEWFIEHLPVPHTPRQIEFARLNTSYTITSKRKLKAAGGCEGGRRAGMTRECPRLQGCAEEAIRPRRSVISVRRLAPLAPIVLLMWRCWRARSRSSE